MSDPAALLEELRHQLRQLGSVLVCYSGGIDSALVLAVAHEQLGERAIGMTAVSPSVPLGEQEDAARIAHLLGATHRFVDSHEIEREGYSANQPDRCFHCKSELYDVAEQQRRAWGLEHIANGTNLDDLGDYRPGLEAAKRAGVRSPLLEAGLRKADVRAVARLLGMPDWDKPAAACLASRIPYGSNVTRERLAQIGGLEAELRRLGLRQLRVRWHDAIARLEVRLEDLPRLVAPELREQILAAGRRHGFTYVTVDLAGYRTGSLNEVLSGRSLRVI